MWQKNYAYEDIPQAIEALPELRRELERHPASRDALLQIFVAGYGWQEATELLDSLDRELPGLKRTGCSEYISGDMEHPCGVKLNLLGTEEAEILVVELPCTPGGEEGAASQLKELLERGFSVGTALGYCMNDADFCKELMRDYADSYEKRTAELDGALESGAMKLYRTYVHSLKSASKTVGADDVAELSLELEQASGRDDAELVSARNGELKELFGRRTEQIRTALGTE